MDFELTRRTFAQLATSLALLPALPSLVAATPCYQEVVGPLRWVSVDGWNWTTYLENGRQVGLRMYPVQHPFDADEVRQDVFATVTEFYTDWRARA